jgi:uncharacterized protein YdaU (DUF1376 family)
LTLITDWIFSHRKPFPAEKEEIFRQIRPRNSLEKSTLLKVLSEFFTLTASGWITEKIAEEIADYEDKCAKASKSALLRWENERTAKAMRTHSEGTTDADALAMLRARVPSTSNQEPETKSEGAVAPPPPAELALVNGEGTPPPDPPPPAKKEKGAARQRNELLDALAVVGGGSLESVTRALWGETAKALADIREVCPDVEPDMIRVAAASYRAEWPKVTLSPSALAKHWGKYAPGAKKEGARVHQGIAEPAWDWRALARDIGLGTEHWAMLERADKIQILRKQMKGSFKVQDVAD